MYRDETKSSHFHLLDAMRKNFVHDDSETKTEQDGGEGEAQQLFLLRFDDGGVEHHNQV